MEGFTEGVDLRAQWYAASRNIRIEASLGYGNDGEVWQTSRGTACKVLRRTDSYMRERDSYLRLAELKVDKFERLTVPRLLEFDDEFGVVEMEIVFRPCLIDFAKCYVDFRPDYSSEVWDDWEREKRSLFTQEEWRIVKRILRSLESYGLYYVDPTPGNFQFPRDSV